MKTRSLLSPVFLCFSIFIILAALPNEAGALDWPFRGANLGAVFHLR